MQRYSASYFRTNSNFVIQNLPDGGGAEERLVPALCIVRNILMRGNPTLMSAFLREALAVAQTGESMGRFHPLISREAPVWERVIRGDDANLDYPARTFLEQLWDKYLPEYAFLRPLILPETLINVITQRETEAFSGQQVDFYLPQAFLVVEIDGLSHRRQADADRLRDEHLQRFGVQVVRIPTTEIRSESAGLKKRFAVVRARLEEMDVFWREAAEGEPALPALSAHQTAFAGEQNRDVLVATAAIRFQILLLELLSEGVIRPGEASRIAILDREGLQCYQAAAEDTFRWLEAVCQLQKVSFSRPELHFDYGRDSEWLSGSQADIRIDCSAEQRYTDAYQNQPQIIFLRTDYLDFYKYYKKADGHNPQYVGLLPYDHFELFTGRLVNYSLKVYDESPDVEALKYIVRNVFLPDLDRLDFNPGQLPIIANVLSRADTIGLLPTGGGKSLCYQVAALLQPGISFVVCPIKSLMFDQKLELDRVLFTRTAHITSNDDAEDRERLQREFSRGKYFFVFISPERFQTRSFREYLGELNHQRQIAYAVIDEVHCLSEWGHDFRIAYLNLAKTIRRHCSDFTILALTATASLNVLKDIKIELGVDDYGVRTLTDYTRPELEFEVLDDNNRKREQLFSLLKQDRVFQPENNGRCGLIFTPTVNGQRGCFELANALSHQFGREIPYYSGGVPKINRQPIMAEIAYEAYKAEIQQGFKQDKYPLLVATKAFGMGVNKRNVYYTVHFGIPGSMESLYQEAGRAGRDKQLFRETSARCYVLFGKCRNEELRKNVLERETQLSAIKDNLRHLDGDISTNLFLFAVGNEKIADEYRHMKAILDRFAGRQGRQVVRASDVRLNKAQLEKAIYRLSLLGIIDDWIVEDFIRGVLEVKFTPFSEATVKQHLQHFIRKYEPQFNLDHLSATGEHKVYYELLHSPGRAQIPLTDKYMVVLLQWIYDHFAYNRRQSLKNIYENCLDVTSGKLSRNDFKRKLEDYFRFSDEAHILQHIAEFPQEYEQWFILLLDKQGELLSREKLQSLQAALSRFLESFMYNVGLDFLSGMLRLIMDDFANTDGEPRLKSAFQKISSWSEHIQEDILNRCFEIVRTLEQDQINEFSRFLIINFRDDESFLDRINRELDDDHSLGALLSPGLQRLTTVNQHIHEQIGLL